MEAYDKTKKFYEKDFLLSFWTKMWYAEKNKTKGCVIMSVTITDILKLPSLQGAKVLAGHSNLDCIISSISVLESADGMEAVPGYARHYGQEILLTAFVAYKDDVDKQCNAIRLVHDEGEVGIILFYVGSVLPKVDQRVIDLSDELGMPLIVMPENHLELRYSDVICEVMEAVIDDRRKNSYFATDVIEQISHTTNTQRSISSVLAIIRDRTQCSVFLFDELGRMLNMAEWPNGRNLPIVDIIAKYNHTDKESGKAVEIVLDKKPYYVIRESLQNADTKIEMLIVKEKDDLTVESSKQIKYVVKTYLNLWTENYAQVDTKQLVSAIINNEPEKMRRIADILKISVERMECVYFFYSDTFSHNYYELTKAKMMIQDYVSAYKNNFLVDIFDETVVVMADRKLELPDEDLQELLNELEENALKARVVIYNPTTTTKKVQEAYRQLQSFKKYVPIVFPKKSVITGGEIAFVGQTKELFDTQSYSSTLEDIMKLQLFTDKRQADLLETMEVFLLDGNMSVAKTAELMFTHKNTIQYRIKSLEGILGHKLTRIPEVYNLYTLAAINRLNKAIWQI